MKKLIMCQGLPGSGKTTWALLECEKSLYTVRINKDEIRQEFEKDGWVWTPKNEQNVIEARDQRIRDAFYAGADIVISDDTNFGRKHEARLRQLARECGAEFEIKRFDIPVEECIRRDAQRSGKARVGEVVIRQMAAWYGIPVSSPVFAPVVPDESLMPAIICDLDGTLAHGEHRNVYDFAQSADDRCDFLVRSIIHLFYTHEQYKIIYITGREEKFRLQTINFLETWHCPSGLLYMRMTGDHRKDSIVKYELFDRYVRGKYNVRFVLDDRNQVVEMWRKIGLKCLQVADGAF